ncbi:aminoglycoside phosphotransferase (APT) family kinase protein [Crossiella equi]|uniref:Aminoglycoside phosphotransferase (APT) family kinase protein n=1 Tax=Crossiella equi TaxID=130796 RepID=A0ABS5AQF7_9PSEU|nr:phosphotransferase [Crossiella equi]MBP2478632.1 aminoglycoside phosphotransferase (APT) family kinase protein [Crossiella equi]
MLQKERVGSADWTQRVLARHWAGTELVAAPTPLSGSGDGEVVTHTAGLWLVPAHTGEHVLKVQLNPDALRPPAFYGHKQELLRQAAEAGLPVGRPVPTTAGADTAWVDGTTCELLPRYPAPVGPAPSAAQVDALVDTCLDLRAFLDSRPERLTRELAPLPVPRLVDEPDWRLALADARTRLLPEARRRDDDWGRFATGLLEDLDQAAGLLLAHDLPAWGQAPHRPAITHADLHHHHFMVAAPGSPDVVAVLDFDNLQVTDRLLDLAWTAELAMLGESRPSRSVGSLTRFVGMAHNRGLLRLDEVALLGPVLLTHSVPVLVDIAKDILERDLLYPVWRNYVQLLDPARRLRMHTALSHLVV